MAEDKRPDPRGVDDTWVLCEECARSSGASWGSRIDGSRCIAHAAWDSIQRSVVDCLTVGARLDGRGCTLAQADVERLVAAGGGELPALRLRHVRFDGPLSMAGVVILGSVSLERSTFSGRADFEGAVFRENLDMSGTVLNGRAVFARARFARAALFNDAEFHGPAIFAAATFQGPAQFLHAAFRAFADYDGAEFFESALWHGAEFEKAASFGGSRFLGQAAFIGTSFQRELLLSRAEFQNTMPLFDNALLAGSVRFFPEEALASWNNGGARKRGSYVRAASSPGIRNLRKALEDSRNEPGANVLYEIEMKCRAREARRSPPSVSRFTRRAIIGVYGTASGYGTRPQRSLACLTGLLVAACLLLTLGGYRDAEPQGLASQAATSPRTLTSPESERVTESSASRLRQASFDAVRAAVPGWTVDENGMTELGRWVVTLTRIVGVVLLGLCALSIRAQIKR